MVELRMVTDQQIENFDKLRRNFESKHPDVIVTIESVSDRSKIEAKLSGDNPPDIIQMQSEDFYPYIKRGLVQDLTPFFDSEQDIYKLLPTGLINVQLVDGKLPAIPFNPLTYVIIYNKERFDESNIPYPSEDWTWDEFLEASKRLTKKDEEGNITQVGIYLPHGNIGQIERFVIENGGSFLSADGLHAKGYMNGSQSVDAVKKYVQLFREHQVSPITGKDPVLSGLNLAHEKIAMFWEISKLVQWIRPQKLENKMGVVGLPKIRDKEKTNLIWMLGFGLSTKSKQPQIAWEFLREMLSPDEETAKKWTKSSIASTKLIAEQSGQLTDPLWLQPFKELNYGKKSAMHLNPSWDKIARELDLGTQLHEMLVEKGLDVQEVLTKWAEKIEDNIASMSQETVYDEK